MKTVLLISFLFALSLPAEPLEESVLYHAASDELARSIKKLRIEKQTKPYYISYRIEELHSLYINAQFGGLMYSNEDRSRDVYVDVRVGNYDFDNSNFICQTRSMELIESEHASLPIEDDYDAIRQALWIVTDGTYKQALERLSRKAATLQNHPQKDTVADFARVKTSSIEENILHMDVDNNYWENITVHLSGVLKEYPSIQESNVAFSAENFITYFLDTEGNKSRMSVILSGVEITFKAQSMAGDPLEDHIGFYAHDPKELPDVDAMAQQVRALAETLSLQVNLEKAEEYSGPVLFVGQAAAELFFQILGKGVSDPKSPLFENDMLAQSAASDMGGLAKRLGRRVMSTFLSAVDDPTLNEYQGTPLIGHYTVDDQSVPAERVQVVMDGKLISVLMSRAPTKRTYMTNGHGKYRDEDYGPRVIGMVGNLFISSTEKHSLDDLYTQLIALCNDYGIPYGIVVSRLSTTTPLTIRERYMRYFRAASGMNENTLLSSPVTMYKVDVATESVTLIRGLDFSDVTSRVLRDIVATSDKEYIYNFFYYDEHNNGFPMTVIAPAVLVEEMDMEETETKPVKLPILPHPFFK